MIYCTNCGHANPDGSNFCSQCGTALEKRAAQPQSGSGAEPSGAQSTGTPTDTGSTRAPSDSGRQPPASGDTTRTMPAMAEDEDAGLSSDDVEAVNALPRGSALLIVRRGADAGSRFLLDTESTTVGRSQDADIMLDDISVSRRHAVFTRTGDGVVVKDVGSLNGTYVNRQMVDEQLLRAGDEVQIGKFRLVFYSARG
jgi:pSer/pThr/pTyr-binding forkhead associated (FHA) protein